VPSTPKCPQCHEELKLVAKGQLDFWSCPKGHGLGFTLSEAYGRIQDDEISRIWHESETASPGTRTCPMCDRPMLSVTTGVDDDEAAEGEAGDRSDSRQVSLDVCREDQLIWFDPGELDELPLDIPNPKPSAEEQRSIDLIAKAYDHDLVQALESEANQGLANHLANRIVRRHPGFVRLLDHAVYGRALDDATHAA
jgi:Zn-finger nucleic acid-binding protein